MDIYFINTRDNHWQFKKQGAKHATFTADTKAEILKMMQDFVRDKNDVAVRIQRKDGTFQDVRSY